MSSMNENLLDKIARADFSMETDFKSVLRKRLFESGANKRPISRAFSERDCLRAAQIRNPGSFSSSVYLIWNWIWYLRQEIWISSGSRNRKIRISDENGNHAAAGLKTAHRGFFRAWKGLSWHRPSFLL